MSIAYAVPRGREKVAVCVCTCKRPLMLQKCLESLGSQTIFENIDPIIIVVDNEELPNNQSIVMLFNESSRIPVYYAHEPDRGIATARNKALDVAKMHAVNWIAFIDDDAEAHPDWLANLMSADYLDTPILVGDVRFVNEGLIVPGDSIPKKDKQKEGSVLSRGRTGNVRFSSALIEAGLRFDENLKLSGGEDVRFFRDAHKLGFEARYTGRAIVNETIHPTRQSWRFQTYRHFAHSAAQTSHDLRDGKGAYIALELAKLIVISPLAIIELTVGNGLKASKRLARIAGMISALAGKMPEPYQTIHGK